MFAWSAIVTTAVHFVATWTQLGLTMFVALLFVYALSGRTPLWPSISAEFEILRYIDDQWSPRAQVDDTPLPPARRRRRPDANDPHGWRVLLTLVILCWQFVAAIAGTKAGGAWGDALRKERSQLLREAGQPGIPFVDASETLGDVWLWGAESFLLLIFCVDMAIFVNQNRAARAERTGRAMGLLVGRAALQGAASWVGMPMVHYGFFTNEVAQVIFDRGLSGETFGYRLLFRAAALLLVFAYHAAVANL